MSRGLDILLVEDRELDRELIRKLVKERNLAAKLSDGDRTPWTLATRGTVQEASDYLFAPPLDRFPQVVLVDLSLESGEDGLNLIDRVSRMSPAIAVIAWSQSATRENWQECARLGATDFISKNQRLSHWDFERRVLFALQNKRQVGALLALSAASSVVFATRAIGVAHEVSRQINVAQRHLAPRYTCDSDLRAGAVMAAQKLDHLRKMMANYLRDQKHSKQVTQASALKALELIRTVIEENRIYWTERYKKTGFDVDAPEDSEDLTFVADPTKLRCIMENLIENAIKFQNAKRPRLGIGLNRRIVGDIVWQEITVSDHGPGMPKEFQGRSFSPGAMGKDQRIVTGWGVGLYYSSLIASQHQVEGKVGELVAANRDDGGAIITVRIPAQLDLAEIASASDC